MKYIEEYRNSDLIHSLATLINRVAVREYTFMEVCGGHTAAIHRFGIPSLLPAGIRLISGPGCPVCVTSREYIDRVVACSGLKDVIVATFGDLLRIPGSDTSLEKQKASGADIRIVVSALDALSLATGNPGKKVLFPAIGFETTAPGTAVTIKEAFKAGVNNFFVLSAHKIMPPAMELLIRDGVKIDGFICPGHVAAITGSKIFGFIPEGYGLGCVVTGFEPTDLLQAVYMLVQQVNTNKPEIQIQYSRAVTFSGNEKAVNLMDEIFVKADDYWRGFGIIPGSGLKLGKKYERFDAEKAMPVKVNTREDDRACICGEILRGLKTPDECKLFGSRCKPDNPVGACMVSNEGVCNTYYKYRSDA